ncbi:MAG: ATP-binding protein, partial [Pseudomonadota bacterium]
FRDAARTPEIDISARRAQSSWVFEVRDNGIGINPAFHDRIFDPLSRLHGVDSEYKGNGIGLSLAHRIVDAHGGRIWVDSEESQGSSFFVELPTYL